MTVYSIAPKADLTAHELCCIVRACYHPQLQLALEMISQLGIHPSECLRLKATDISIELALITITNASGMVRILPLPPALLSRIPSFLSSNYLFSNKNGQPFSMRSLQLEAQKASKRCSIHLRYGVCTFRHAFAENLVKQGVSDEIIMDWLGIVHRKSVKRYH